MHSRSPCLILVSLLIAPPLWADWRADIGYTQLAAELGAAMPTGEGIPLLQGEASSAVASPLDYMPQTGPEGGYDGTGTYAGKTFYAESGDATFSGHAQVVASYYYANGGGVARGATEIHGYDASDFVSRLRSGFQTPEVLPGRVQNHSWVGSAGTEAADVELLRRFDYMLNRDGRLAAVGLFNDPGVMQGLLGNCYHALVVGVRSGQHTQTGSTQDGLGRMKPDLVANAELTSWATPMVAGAAALLLEGAAAIGSGEAERPEVIKAILLAGASKRALPQWHRANDAKPYDAVFGAGELNIANAWHILQAGMQPPSTSVERSALGWDLHATTADSQGRRYFFQVPEGRYANSFSAALSWHRRVTTNVFKYGSSLSNLTLKLFAADGFSLVGTPLAQSASEVDNVEHLYLQNLPSGQYALEVTATEGDRDYGLAWEAQLGHGPELEIRCMADGQLFVDSSALDPFATYVIESSTDLKEPWKSEHTFRTANATPAYTETWQDVAASPGGKFYRLRWTAVR